MRELVVRRPRVAGCLLMTLTAILSAVNAHAESRQSAWAPSGSYYPSFYIFGYPGALFGAWLLVVGWPEKSPRWWLLGTALVLVGGFAWGCYALQRSHPYF